MFNLERAASHLPEFLFSPTTGSADRPRLIATGYIKTIETAFSGSSYYLARAGMAIGVFDGIFAAQSEVRRDLPLKAQAALWKASRKIRGQKAGGFKFSRDFQDRIWKENMEYVAGCDIIDNCQTRGVWFHEHSHSFDIRVFPYIDGTLHEYFTTYDKFDCAIIDSATRREAIEDERLGYANAHHIIAMSERTRQSLVTDYGVPQNKISIVVPGANIDDAMVALPRGNAATPIPDEFTLGFIGLYPLRKGLDRLSKAVEILRKRGRQVRLRVIGNCPENIQAMDGVDYFGVVRKGSEPQKFVDIVSGVNLGCQLSWAELTGIAMMEFLRFGVPILATDTGGMPDILAGGGGVIVPREITAEALAEEIDLLVSDGDRYKRLATEAQGQAQWASWTRAADEIGKVIAETGR